MPLNSIPPTTTVQNLITKINAAYHQCHVDVRFIGGLVKVVWVFVTTVIECRKTQIPKKLEDLLMLVLLDLNAF